MTRSTLDLVVGIAMIVLGVLMVLGELSINALLPYAGIVLIVLGIIILIGRLPGGILLGLVALIAGILLVTNFFDLPREVAQAMGIVNLILGIVLIVLGVLRLLGK